MFCALSLNKSTASSKITYASYSILFKELKNYIYILVDKVAFKLWIKTLKMLFGSITQEPLGQPTFWFFDFLGQCTLRCVHHEDVDYFEIRHKTC